LKKKNKIDIKSIVNRTGKVIKTKRGLTVEDSETGLFFKIAKRESRGILPNDEVEYTLSARRWAKIQNVLTRNTKEFISYLTKRRSLVLSSPMGFEENFTVKVTNHEKSNFSNELVKIEITTYPTAISYGEGRIIRTLPSKSLLETSSEIAITKFSLRHKWEKSVISDSNKLKKLEFEVPKIDLRNKSFVTIDGKSAKDFDDAVYGERNKKGQLILYVAIADVSRYVRENSTTDQEAQKRGTSTYFTQKVIPMLPEIVSNDICSLKPNEDRYCLVSKITINKYGLPEEAEFFESIIESKARLTYERVARERKLGKFHHQYAQSLNVLADIYSLLSKAKKRRKALELDIPEFFPRFKNNKLFTFEKAPRNIAHRMIEEFMLIANICSAEILNKSKIPVLYRIHPKPDSAKIKQLQTFLRSRKINVSLGQGNKVSDLYTIIEQTKDRKDREAINIQILQSLGTAIYQREMSEHFALAYPAYTHFTSPIRRYPDLIVHRALKALIQSQKDNKLSFKNTQNWEQKNYKYNHDSIDFFGKDLSMKERTAEKAEREALNHLKCELAKSNIGNSFEGRITGVTNFGLFILLNKLNIEGLCHIKNLPRREYYEYDNGSQMLKSSNSNHSYSLGDRIKAKIDRVDVFKQMIDLKIVK
tara:strand:- start:7868 stop:9811 length:1944 start_codon:yes stop_codon:yes gene_type:complete